MDQVQPSPNPGADSKPKARPPSNLNPPTKPVDPGAVSPRGG